MIPNKVTIPQLFMVQCRHLVPIFQRPYVWSQRDQWEPLWEDIARKANEALAANNLQAQPRRHFMGAVVVKSLPAYGLEYPSTEVIDGQQRLTTMQVLLIALRDSTRLVKYDRVGQMLQGLTENPPLSGAQHERYKVVPTTTDRVYFESVWAAGSPDGLMQRHPPTRQKYARYDDPPPRLIGAYLYFYNAIQRFAEDTTLETEVSPVATESDNLIHRRLEALMIAITQGLELVRIDLEQDDDPQVIFETLNARGEKLLPSDLARNFIFLEATRQYGNQAKVSDLYQTYWHPYDSPEGAKFWKEKVSQGRLTHPRFELFMFHFVTSFITKPEDDIQLAHLFRAFRDWWGDRGSTPKVRQVESELQRIQRYAEMFRRLHATTDTNRLEVFARRLRIMDTSTVYPLLLFLFVERAAETEIERDGILSDLESYLVRRMVCGLTPKGYNRIFVKLLTDLRKSGPVTRTAIQSHLLGLTGDTAKWPTDDEFKATWLSRPVYAELRQQRIVMILEAIEWQYYGSKQEHKPFDASLYSIEHILPQNPQAQDWPLPIAANTDETTRVAAQVWRDQLKHTFGNLTLVTGPLNSLLSNGPYSEKLEQLQESVLRLNRYYERHHIDEWTEERIIERSARLFEEAVKIWPRPDAAAV